MMTPEDKQAEVRAADELARVWRTVLEAVAGVLTDEQREKFMDTAIRRWGQFEHEEVTPADVLDYTTDYDEFLEQTEPFFSEHGDELPYGRAHTAVMHALILTGRKLTVDAVIALEQKAGQLPAPQYPDLTVGLRLPTGNPANTLLVFARAQWAMREAGVPESEITRFHYEVREHHAVLSRRALADVARWVMLADDCHMQRPVPYDPVPDLGVLLFGLVKAGTVLSPEASQALANITRAVGTKAPAESAEHLRQLLTLMERQAVRP
jgi:hypothetical protein